MFKKWLGYIAVSFAVLIGFSIVNTEQQVSAATEPHYTIATDTTFPPFEFQGKNGKYVGIDMDLLAAIAKKEHFTYKLTPMSFNSATQSVLSGQIDGVIAGMTITDEREAVFDFSKSYYKTGIIMAVNKASKIKKLTDLKGKTVALKTGTGSAEYARGIQKKYGFKVTYFNDSNTMYNDVKVGNSDATFEDMPVMQYAIKNGVALKIVTKPTLAGYYGFAVKKGQNKALLQAFNSGLAKIKADGTYQKIVNKYLDASASKFSGSKADNTTFWGLIKSNKTQFINGLVKTIQLTIISILLASIWGIILGLLGVSPYKWLQGLSTTIIYIFRGLPLMVLAFFIYIGLPNLTGDKIPAFVAGIVTLVLNEGAYIGAFVRGGIEAVDKGQMEAARSLGLPYGRAMSKVIMPQGVKIMIPSFINQFIITLKDTSILSAIGIIELTQTGTVIISRNMQGFKVWLIVAIIYLVVITLLTWLSNWVKTKIK
ncbi:amino acid ABC transporter substrate-binding protein/permease [Periweissella beninensis]|uniref:amino acid ABC transporter substrate-binding protein/permease n=1 Tax=Periweissella beninensis TaxID=504936 RepID=UPI0021A43E27|nr:amino acid ABC transporter substrate-binding protein/permease [Periweissella beninensis]MCT4395592.1 ABC transporter permease subunit [Periweissella beninensis]